MANVSVQFMSTEHLSLFKSLKRPNLRETLFYDWPGYKSVASFLLSRLVVHGITPLPLIPRADSMCYRFVSIVSSCIDVACHVNMHFGVSAEK